MPFGAPGASDEEEFIVDLEPQSELPNGDYEVQVMDVKSKESKAGNPMLIWSCVVTEGAHAGTEIAAFVALTPDSQWKITETIVALGLGDPEKQKTASFKKTDAIGLSAIATVEKSPGYKPSIKSFKPHPRGPGYKKGGLTPEMPGATAEEAEAELGEKPPF